MPLEVFDALLVYYCLYTEISGVCVILCNLTLTALMYFALGQAILISWHGVSTEICPRPTDSKSIAFVAQYELGESIKEPSPLTTSACDYGYIKTLL